MYYVAHLFTDHPEPRPAAPLDEGSIPLENIQIYRQQSPKARNLIYIIPGVRPRTEGSNPLKTF